MYLNSLWAVVEKETGKIVAGYSNQNAYTSKGRANAALKKCYGSISDRYEIIELIPKETRSYES